MHIIVSLELVGLLYVFGQCRQKVAVVAAAVAVVAAADGNKENGLGVQTLSWSIRYWRTNSHAKHYWESFRHSKHDCLLSWRRRTFRLLNNKMKISRFRILTTWQAWGQMAIIQTTFTGISSRTYLCHICRRRQLNYPCVYILILNPISMTKTSSSHTKRSAHCIITTHTSSRSVCALLMMYVFHFGRTCVTTLTRGPRCACEKGSAVRLEASWRPLVYAR